MFRPCVGLAPKEMEDIPVDHLQRRQPHAVPFEAKP